VKLRTNIKAGLAQLKGMAPMNNAMISGSNHNQTLVEAGPAKRLRVKSRVKTGQRKALRFPTA
jgi:hypothetical protein